MWTVYGFLLDENKLEIVFKMTPKRLEIFLRESGEQEELKKKLQQLLHFYDVTRQLPSKMDLLRQLAFGTNPSYNLYERNKFLRDCLTACNILCHNSMDEVRQQQFMDEELKIKHEIQVAEIQIEMSETLEESYKTADVDGPVEENNNKNNNKMFYKSAIDNIKAKLYSVHELKEKAGKYRLFTYILKMLALLNQNSDVNTVEVSWNGILRLQLLQADNKNERHLWLKHMSLAVETIGKQWTRKQSTAWLIPHGWLLLNIEQMDIYAVQDRHDSSCEVALMLERGGVKRSFILTAYLDLIQRMEKNEFEASLCCRFVKVQKCYLEYILGKLDKSTHLEVEEREEVIHCYSIAQALEQYLYAHQYEPLVGLDSELKELATQFQTFLSLNHRDDMINGLQWRHQNTI